MSGWASSLAHRPGNLFIVAIFHDLAKVEMDFLGLFGRGDLAGADGPDRLVGDHDLAHLLGRKPGQRAVELAADHFGGLARLALLQQLPDADDRRQPGCQGRVNLLVDLLVRLA